MEGLETQAQGLNLSPHLPLLPNFSPRRNLQAHLVFEIDLDGYRINMMFSSVVFFFNLHKVFGSCNGQVLISFLTPSVPHHFPVPQTIRGLPIFFFENSSTS